MIDTIYTCDKEAFRGFRGIITRKHVNHPVYIFSGVDFWDRNYDYILSNATAKAVEIAQKTGKYSDVEDFRQMILIFMWKRVGRYKKEISAAKTFIEVCMESAKKNIIRDFFRKKKKEIETVRLDGFIEQNSADEKRNHVADIVEFIENLPDQEKEICRMYLLDDLTIQAIARERKCQRKVISAVLRRSLLPLAVSLGVEGRTLGVLEKVLPEAPFGGDPGGSSPKL